jgi:hypothetical protein
VGLWLPSVLSNIFRWDYGCPLSYPISLGGIMAALCMRKQTMKNVLHTIVQTNLEMKGIIYYLLSLIKVNFFKFFSI